MSYSCIAVYVTAECHRAFELALESDPSRLDVLEAFAGELADQQEWAELERIYRRMAELLDELLREGDEPSSSSKVVAEIFHRLALLHRDHLDDPASALTAMGDALAHNPQDLAGHLLAADLAVEVDDVEQAYAYLGRSARLDPKRAETYHGIFTVAQQIDDAEMGYLASSVTALMGVATDDERITFHKFRPESVPQHQSSLRPEAWDWLRPAEADVAVDGVMRALASPVIRARVSQLEADGKLADLPDSARLDPETSTISVVRSLGWAARLLGLPTPAIFVNEEMSGTLIAPVAKQQSVIAGAGALRGRSLGQLAFFAGRHMALRLPEHELCAHLRTVDELTACFLAALEIVLDTGPGSGDLGVAVRALTRIIVDAQTEEERDDLDDAVRRFERAGGRVNMAAWAGSVERIAARAGLLLCGDLETAVAIVRDPEEQALLSAERRVDDLQAFFVSEEMLQLRSTLGSTLSDDE